MPAGHRALQKWGADAPLSVENRPAEQNAHRAAPALALKVPTGQVAQLDDEAPPAPEMKVPGWQRVQNNPPVAAL